MEGANLIHDLLSQGTVDSQTLDSPCIACVVVGGGGVGVGQDLIWTAVHCIS